MLTVKENISVKAITFNFIDSTRMTNENKVTVPLNKFRDLELTAIDCYGNEKEHLVRFYSQDNEEVDTYTINENTFNLLYKTCFKHDFSDKRVSIRSIITFYDINFDYYITIFKEDIESVSCVTYKNKEVYRIELADNLFEISEEDYCYFKKMIIGEK